jgi:DNA-binding MarR family transcriptional regulator
MHEDPRKSLPESSTAKLVLLYIDTQHGVSLERLREDLDLSYLELYPILERLETAGRIEEETSGQYRVASR